MTKRLHASLTSPINQYYIAQNVPLFIDCQLIGFRCRGIDEFAKATASASATTVTATRLFAATAAKTRQRLQSLRRRRGGRLEAFALRSQRASLCKRCKRCKRCKLLCCRSGVAPAEKITLPVLRFVRADRTFVVSLTIINFAASEPPSVPPFGPPGGEKPHPRQIPGQRSRVKKEGSPEGVLCTGDLALRCSPIHRADL